MKNLNIQINKDYEYYGESESSPTIEIIAVMPGNNEETIKNLTEEDVQSALNDWLAMMMEKNAISLFNMSKKEVGERVEDYWDEELAIGYFDDPADPETKDINPVLFTQYDCAVMWNDVVKQTKRNLLEMKQRWNASKNFGDNGWNWKYFFRPDRTDFVINLFQAMKGITA